jgi:hypothetical protein
MADFMAGGPDDVTAHLAEDAHRSPGRAGTPLFLAAEGDPGGSRPIAGDGNVAEDHSITENHSSTEDDGVTEDHSVTGEHGTAEDHGGVTENRGAEHGGRDDRLADFAQHRCADTARPNAWHVMILNDLTGADDRCPDATDDEAFGLMGRWKAVESWAAARKLGVVREMIRRRAVPEKGMATADLPWEWERELEHEVAAQLRISLVAAHKLTHVAWSLEARLPGIGQALAEDRLDPGQAKMIVTETDALPDDKATATEQLILAGLDDCHTWADLIRLVQRAVCTVDPDGATRRREEAERQSARVRFWRESSGACALAGHALPTDEALAAWGQVEARAQHYRAHGIREYIDLLRVMAYLDMLNGTPAAERIARWSAEAAAKGGTATPDPDPDPDEAAPAPGRATPGPRGSSGQGGTPGGRPPGNGRPRSGTPGPGRGNAPEGDGRPGAGDDTDDPGHTSSADEPLAAARPAGTGPGSSSPGSGSPEDSRPAGPSTGPELRAKVNLTIPMGTATGYDNQPGEAWELGALDPALARQLLAAAARSPGSEFCVTVTDEHGYAVGHGCGKPARPAKTAKPGPQPAGPAPPGPAPPPRTAFIRRDGSGPPGGFGSWALTLPGTATTYTVDLKPVPTHACDHAYEAAGHDPSDWLRHVVQVRDGKCSFPSCGRHAGESDFEHSTPHEEGGKTCACNCHSCSRSCHQVKQHPGWSVTSPKPGWHQWTTPSGRAYIQGPWRYPA